MSIQSDGKTLRVTLAAPEGGAPLSLKDGDAVLWQGDVTDRLEVDLDLEEWNAPEPLRQLFGKSLPPLSGYSRGAFVPLATEAIALATLNLDPQSGTATWSEPAVLDGQMLPLSMMAGTLHYAQSVFEGQKAYFTTDGERTTARLFRAGRNAQRMWTSALRMGIPVDLAGSAESFAALYDDLSKKAIRANASALFTGEFQAHRIDDPDFDWHSTPPALYLRPIIFASGPVLGVKPSDQYVFAVYVTPVGKYRSDMVLRVEREHPRAVKGGTGAVKASCNYAPTLTMMMELAANRSAATAQTPWTDVFDDILFTGPGGEIEEMGGANFFVLAEENGALVLHTPPSVQEDDGADTILPGITRDTVLEIARSLGLDVRVDRISLARLMELSVDEARRTAVFTTGTAAGIAPVVALLDGKRVQRFAVWDDVNDPVRHRKLDADPVAPGSTLEVGKQIRTLLFRCQLGDVDGIARVAGEHAGGLLRRLERWVDAFDV